MRRSRFHGAGRNRRAQGLCPGETRGEQADQDAEDGADGQGEGQVVEQEAKQQPQRQADGEVRGERRSFPWSPPREARPHAGRLGSAAEPARLVDARFVVTLVVAALLLGLLQIWFTVDALAG